MSLVLSSYVLVYDSNAFFDTQYHIIIIIKYDTYFNIKIYIILYEFIE